MAGGTASGGMVVRFVDSVFAITGGPRLLPSPGRTASTGELGGVMAIRAALSGRKGSRRRPANSAVRAVGVAFRWAAKRGRGQCPADSSSAGVFVSRASCTGRGEALPGHAVHAAVLHDRQEVCSQPHRPPSRPRPSAHFTQPRSGPARRVRLGGAVGRVPGGPARFPPGRPGPAGEAGPDQVARRRQGRQLRPQRGSRRRPSPRGRVGAAQLPVQVGRQLPGQESLFVFLHSVLTSMMPDNFSRSMHLARCRRLFTVPTGTASTAAICS